MRTFLLALTLLALPGAALAQTVATPASKLAWDQAAPDAPTASAYTYTRFDDGAATGVALTGVTCAGATSPFVCQVPLVPPFTPGAHSVALTAGSAAGTSLKSTPLAFTFVTIPTIPANLRIIP